MTPVRRWAKLWCHWCKYKTAHKCLPEIQTTGGLLWKCERCGDAEVFTPEAINRAERVV